jgi:hypothetical protein
MPRGFAGQDRPLPASISALNSRFWLTRRPGDLPGPCLMRHDCVVHAAIHYACSSCATRQLSPHHAAKKCSANRLWPSDRLCRGGYLRPRSLRACLQASFVWARPTQGYITKPRMRFTDLDWTALGVRNCAERQGARFGRLGALAIFSVGKAGFNKRAIKRSIVSLRSGHPYGWSDSQRKMRRRGTDDQTTVGRSHDQSSS